MTLLSRFKTFKRVFEITSADRLFLFERIHATHLYAVYSY